VQEKKTQEHALTDEEALAIRSSFDDLLDDNEKKRKIEHAGCGVEAQGRFCAGRVSRAQKYRNQANKEGKLSNSCCIGR